jgi:hypothetical protein
MFGAKSLALAERPPFVFRMPKYAGALCVAGVEEHMNFAKEQIDEQKEKLGETVSAAAITGRMAEPQRSAGKTIRRTSPMPRDRSPRSARGIRGETIAHVAPDSAAGDRRINHQDRPGG